MANSPYIDVDKVGRAIVTDSSASEAQGGVPHCGGRYPGQANVDRFRLHVKTVESDARVRAAGPQKFIGLRRSKSADYVDLAAGIVQGSRQVVEQVKQTRVEMMQHPSATVAQKMIELRQRFR